MDDYPDVQSGNEYVKNWKARAPFDLTRCKGQKWKGLVYINPGPGATLKLASGKWK